MFANATARRPRAAKKETGGLVPFGLPMKGLNARDALVSTPPGFAFNLVNAIPENYGIRTRKGFTQYMSAVGDEVGPVHTIMVYYPAAASPVAAMASPLTPVHSIGKMFRPVRIAPFLTFSGGKIFAARGVDVYDVTAGGDGSAVTAETGISGATAFWTWLNFQNVAGNFLVAVNDGGGYAYYNGSAWTTPVMGGGVGQISGVDPTDFVHVTEFKKRLWFVEKDTTDAWYLDESAITGAATRFPFGEQFTRGGHLVALANWTIDAGEGVDDYLVAVGSQGDVVIYKGIDPDDASTFQLHGVWQVGPLPVGRRQVSARHGEVHILTHLGMIPVSKLLSLRDQLDFARISASYYIDPLLTRLMADYAGQSGWQIIDVPKEEMTLIGVPLTVANLGGDFLSLKVANADGGGWSILRDTGYTSLASIDSIAVAGTEDGRIVLAFNGAYDDVIEDESFGRPITCEVTPSYQPLGTPGRDKRVLLIRPCFLTRVKPNLRFVILFDYRPPGAIVVPTLPGLGDDVWDTALWDFGIWSGTPIPIKKWLGARGEGSAVTPQLKYVAAGDTLLTAIDLWVEQGGVL